MIYHLGLSIDDEMNFAYNGERHCSKCGKIDQICAYNRQVSLMEFDGNDLSISPLEVGKDLYFVFADLNCSKNTQNILESLNSCFPHPKTDLEKKTVNYLGLENKETKINTLDNTKKRPSGLFLFNIFVTIIFFIDNY